GRMERAGPGAAPIGRKASALKAGLNRHTFTFEYMGRGGSEITPDDVSFIRSDLAGAWFIVGTRSHRGRSNAEAKEDDPGRWQHPAHGVRAASPKPRFRKREGRLVR